MQAFKNYLQNFPHYTPKAFEEVEPLLSVKYIAEGEYFLREGKICGSIAFIEQGLMRLFYLTDGKETTKCFCKENTITCSYRSFVTRQASDIAIQAVESSKLLLLSYNDLQRLYEKNLFWQQLGRLVSENEYLITNAHHRFLSDLSATERYLQVLETDGELLQRVPLQYLASYLQIAPETLSRIRKKIART